MDKSFTDVLVEEMKGVMLSVRQETREMFKGKQPFRKVKQSDVDRISQYLTMSPEVKQNLMQSFPDEFTNYQNKMEQEIREYGNG